MRATTTLSCRSLQLARGERRGPRVGPRRGRRRPGVRRHGRPRQEEDEEREGDGVEASDVASHRLLLRRPVGGFVLVGVSVVLDDDDRWWPLIDDARRRCSHGRRGDHGRWGCRVMNRRDRRQLRRPASQRPPERRLDAIEPMRAPRDRLAGRRRPGRRRRGAAQSGRPDCSHHPEDGCSAEQ